MGQGAAAVFLDRDGTLIEDVGYPRDPSEVRVLPGTAEALRRLESGGMLLVIVSNQSGVGRGIVTTAEAAAVDAEFRRQFAERGVTFAGVYYCPHGPEDGCGCRKPEPGMLIRAAEELKIALAASFMVGDKASDSSAGKRAGCRSVVLNPRGEAATDADLIADDWSDAVSFILDSRVPA
jgi:D-glycero-D-manno-heptose 1,7-bisphosphate phosphatase